MKIESLSDELLGEVFRRPDDVAYFMKESDYDPNDPRVISSLKSTANNGIEALIRRISRQSSPTRNNTK